MNDNSEMDESVNTDFGKIIGQALDSMIKRRDEFVISAKLAGFTTQQALFLYDKCRNSEFEGLL